MDGVNYIKFIAALALVLALVALTGLVLRRFGNGFSGRPAKSEARLEQLESLPLDNRRRLVLVRRGEVAHLLLLGVNGEQVIESAIPLAEPDATPKSHLPKISPSKAGKANARS